MRMLRVFGRLFDGLIWLICITGTAYGGHSFKEDIKFKEIAEDIWIYTTTKDLDKRVISSNGLIIRTSEGIILVDTPWDTKLTQLLVEKFKKINQEPIIGAYVTHAHYDRMGGIRYLIDNQIPVYGSKQTIEIAKKKGYTTPNQALNYKDTTVIHGDTYLTLFYPGKGHAPDNIVIWLPQSKILFGGCLVKSLIDKDLGGVYDADIKNWSMSVMNVINRFHDIEIVVPGHGPWRNTELLLHTLKLIEQNK